MGFLSDLQQRTADQYEKASGGTQAYTQGNRNVASQALLGSTALAPFISVVQATSEALTPDVVEDVMNQGAEYLLSTGPGQAFTKYMQEHPEVAQNADNAMAVAEIFGVGKVIKDILRKAPTEAPNRLPGFYEGGPIERVKAVAKQTPLWGLNLFISTFNPKSRALAREGVPHSVRSVAKNVDKKRGKFKDEKGIDPWSESWVPGQLDQTTTLNVQAGRGHGRLQGYADETMYSVGRLDKESIAKAFEFDNPQQYAGVDIDDELITRVTNHTRDTWRSLSGKPMPEGAPLIFRRPGKYDQLHSEARGRNDRSKKPSSSKKASELDKELSQLNLSGSDWAKGMSVAEELYKKFYPNRTGFDSVEEAYEYVSLGLVMKKAGGVTQGRSQIGKYLATKKALEEGKKVHGATLNAYNARKAEIDKFINSKKNKDGSWKPEFVDSKGRIYLDVSHKSGAKAYGGVGDYFVIDQQGNRLSFLTDENDMVGMVPPGHDRIVTMVPPQRSSVFGQVDRPLVKSTPHIGNSKKAASEFANIKPESYQPSDFQGLITGPAVISASVGEEEEEGL